LFSRVSNLKFKFSADVNRRQCPVEEGTRT
jgi:hypothetical protein